MRLAARSAVLLLLFNTTRTTSGPPSTGAAIAMDGGVAVLVLLLFNTTRAHTPDPQAQEPLSQWTEVWPTQPVRTQAVNRHKVGEEETPS